MKLLYNEVRQWKARLPESDQNHRISIGDDCHLFRAIVENKCLLRQIRLYFPSIRFRLYRHPLWRLSRRQSLQRTHDLELERQRTESCS